MPEPPPNSFYAPTRAAWRRWLAKHHATSAGVWLIYDKQSSGKRRLSYADAVEEALCFGWVDSRPNRLDEARYMQMFSPRKPRSPWSKLNQERVERLTAAGLMTPAGLAKVEQAKHDGSWSRFDGVAQTVPPDLKRALASSAEARQYFAAFPPSSKRIILEWIASARTAPTREKRIAETVSMAAKNLRANHYRQPKGK